VVTGGRTRGTPCGACRQVLAELARPSTPILLAGPTGGARVLTLADLLPYTFRLRPEA
jgi:cytidine deaminase